MEAAAAVLAAEADASGDEGLGVSPANPVPQSAATHTIRSPRALAANRMTNSGAMQQLTSQFLFLSISISLLYLSFILS